VRPSDALGEDVVVAETLAHLLGRGAPRNPDRDSLDAWGKALGAVLPRPTVITLEGDLGTGKTTLARALCAGLGVLALDAVTSPTFSLVQQYAAPRGPIVHVDLYRLKGPSDLEALGWDGRSVAGPAGGVARSRSEDAALRHHRHLVGTRPRSPWSTPPQGACAEGWRAVGWVTVGRARRPRGSAPHVVEPCGLP